MPFLSLGLGPELVGAVADEGYTQPTPVQREAIPLVLAGRDVLAGAQTGTGKTAAFVLPILQRLHSTQPAEPAPSRGGGRREASGPARPVRVLVLAPTRELALQVEASVVTYGRRRPVRSAAIYGGVGFEPQVRALRAGPAIVVATPGRLLDHLGQRTIDLSQVEILVLDEADRMLDMGFIRDIRRVLEALPPVRQNLLFSATFSDEIRSLATGLLDRPAMVDVAPRNAAIELVEQEVVAVDRHRKQELLSRMIRAQQIRQALVFVRTKHGANRLAQQLERDGIRVAAIHGNKSQGQRVRALDDFKAGRVDILVATDIAARGLDIDSLPHVVNYELPMVPSDYVHRIGRTGRAGMSGHAVSLVCVDEAGILRDIEKLLGRTLRPIVVQGFEPDPTVRPEPIRLRSGDVRPVRPGSPRPAQARPASPRPAQARPAQARPAPGTAQAQAARPVIGRPGRTGRPAAQATQGAARRDNRQRPPQGGHQRPGPQQRLAAPAPGRALGRQQPTTAHLPVALPGERLRRAAAHPARDRAQTRGED